MTSSTSNLVAMPPQSVVIVEDRGQDLEFATSVVRAAFGESIDVRSARTLEKARNLLEKTAFDLVVLDLNLPDGTGASLLPLIREKRANAWVVVMTVFDDDDHLFLALQQGADGYLLKDESRSDAAELLREIIAGRPPLSARVARRVLKYIQDAAPLLLSAPKASSSLPMPELTPREREVVTLLASGHTAASAAGLLNLSEHTVKAHIKNLYRKLDVSSRAELVRAAIDSGLG